MRGCGKTNHLGRHWLSRACRSASPHLPIPASRRLCSGRQRCRVLPLGRCPTPALPMALRDKLQDALGTSYTITRELGGGGMSRVFVAREEALRRNVVVKVLPPDLLAGVNAERFDRE